ncbi:MAG: thermonuclease family protein [Silvanigrellaceae bacterium]|nr:thermonuclease family protein [Silvanigrellaceae bacterium]
MEYKKNIFFHFARTLFLCFFTLNAGFSFANQETTYVVLKCHDGDTCHLQGAENIHLKVRLIAIDAPEVGKKKGKQKTPDQPFGPESREFLNHLIQGKKVTLVHYGLDPFSRNLVEIYLDKKNINLEIVRNGFAEVYRTKKQLSQTSKRSVKNTPSHMQQLDLEKYVVAEQAAKKEKRGVWSLQKHQSPLEWRMEHKHSSLYRAKG